MASESGHSDILIYSEERGLLCEMGFLAWGGDTR